MPLSVVEGDINNHIMGIAIPSDASIVPQLLNESLDEYLLNTNPDCTFVAIESGPRDNILFPLVSLFIIGMLYDSLTIALLHY